MFKIEQDALIKRPVGEVFPYIADLRNLPQWGNGVIAAEQVTPGPLAASTRFRITAQAPGRKVSSTYTITVYQLDERFSGEGKIGPIPFSETYQFAPTAQGTQIHFVARMVPSGLFLLGQPLIKLLFKRLIAADFVRLTTILEAGAR